MLIPYFTMELYNNFEDFSTYRETIQALSELTNPDTFKEYPENIIQLANKCAGVVEIMDEIYIANKKDTIYDNVIIVLEFIESRLLKLNNISDEEFIKLLASILEVVAGYFLFGVYEIDESILQGYLPDSQLGLLNTAVESDKILIFLSNTFNAFWSSKSAVESDDINHKFQVLKLGKMLKDIISVIQAIINNENIQDSNQLKQIQSQIMQFNSSLDISLPDFYTDIANLLAYILNSLQTLNDPTSEFESKITRIEEIIKTYNLEIQVIPEMSQNVDIILEKNKTKLNNLTIKIYNFTRIHTRNLPESVKLLPRRVAALIDILQEGINGDINYIINIADYLESLFDIKKHPNNSLDTSLFLKDLISVSDYLMQINTDILEPVFATKITVLKQDLEGLQNYL